MAQAQISSKATDKGPITERALRQAFKVIDVKAVDGVVIPVPQQFAGANAEIRVDGDGSCVLNQKHTYLVTVLNSKSDPKAEARKTLSAMADEVVGDAKDKLLQAGLGALRQGKVVQYALKGLKLLSGGPVTLVLALVTNPTDTGKAAEGSIDVKLKGGAIAAIRWIG